MLNQRVDSLTIWTSYEQFSQKYLEEHRDILLKGTFHQVLAFIFYPSITKDKEIREQIALSLNLSYLHHLEAQTASRQTIEAAKTILQVPNDSYFQKHWNQSYPLWRIEKEWAEKEIHFKIIHRLVWTLLRLGETYASLGDERRASLSEATDVIVGSIPLKSPKRTDYLCGEKAYAAHFKHCKSVCHFMAAFEHMRQEDPHLSSLLHWSDSSQIERFLSLSEFFRRELLLLTTPNVKENRFLSVSDILKLPEYAWPSNTNISIHPFPKKISELNHKLRSAELISNSFSKIDK
jgi:hypothetical protein